MLIGRRCRSFLLGLGGYTWTRVYLQPQDALERSRMFFTEVANHLPPRAVWTPRALRASAISRSVVAPAFWAARIIGRTLAACRSALALMTPWANSRAS